MRRRLWRDAASVAYGVCATVIVACGGDANGKGAASSAATPAAPATVEETPRPRASDYRETTLASFGRVTGVVSLDGAAPPDSIVQPTAEAAQDCGAIVTVPTLVARDGRVASAIVWLEGVHAGKPLPLERRYTLEHQDCLLAPRAQAAVVGGTLNIVNDDRIAHVTEVKSARASGSRTTLHFDYEGQVVPLDRALRDAGRLEITCTIHPWAKAWVQVFDHPYFAMSAADGAFALDSVPPGRYAIVAWTERMGEVRDSVTVAANGEARVELNARVR